MKLNVEPLSYTGPFATLQMFIKKLFGIGRIREPILRHVEHGKTEQE